MVEIARELSAQVNSRHIWSLVKNKEKRRMKFVLQQVRSGCRLGRLTEVGGRLIAREIDTPTCMLYTRGGSAPHLTRDVLDRISNLPGIVHMPLNVLADHHEAVEEYGQGIGRFTAMHDFLIYCHLQDPTQTVPAGYNSNAGVALWGRGGKLTLNVAQYMQVIEAFQPDWYLSLCDSDTDRNSSKKRIKKSVDRTLEYLDACIEKHQNTKRLDGAGIIGVIEGGYSLDERRRSARETSKRPVAGFCLEGFHNFGPNTEKFHVTEIEDILTATLSELDAEKPRILPGILTPLEIVDAVRMGIDIFDSSFPYMVTERGSALVFPFHELDPQAPTSSSEVSKNGVSDADNYPYEICLKEKRFNDDFGPVLDECQCYTCRTHTRAYIHHLLHTSELLAGTLLMLHNFQHYFSFFDALRNAAKHDQLDVFRRRLTTLISTTLTSTTLTNTKCVTGDSLVANDVL